MIIIAIMNNFAFLLIPIHLSLFTDGQKLIGSINCTQYKSCFNTTINVTPNNNFDCYGAQSCIDSNIAANYLYCDGWNTCSGPKSATHSIMGTYCAGDNSCLQSNIVSDGLIACYGYNSCSNSNVQLTSFINPLWACASAHSCTNASFKCEKSYNSFYGVNTRFIYINFKGVFTGYNTTIYNNENNVYILGNGYYSLYTLTVYCTSAQSICIADCHGNGCVGLTLICSDSVLTCQYKCQDKECETYKHLVQIYNDSGIDNNYNIQRKIEYESSYDTMAILVNNILTYYNQNFSLFPDIDGSIDLIKSNDYCVHSSYFFSDYLQVHDKTFIVNENEYFCCLGELSCNNVTIKSDMNGSRRSIIFCAGLYSCNNTIFDNVHSVYNLGYAALYESRVNHFDAIVVCSAIFSCSNSFISNGSVVVCMSYIACSNTIISNVQTVIAIGYQSLYNCQLIGVRIIMSLSTQALYNTTILKGEMDNFEIYCQNDDSMCYDIENSTGIELYCYDKTNISINIDGINFDAENVSNLLHCSGNSYSPSISPTVSPTESQFTHDIDFIVSWLETSTAQIGIILATITIILVFLSIYFGKKNHPQTLQKYIQLNNDSAGMILLNDMNNNQDDSYDVSMNTNNNDDENSSIMTYITGFGHKASHLVIVEVSFEIYDVFVDISYLLELYHNNLFEYFGAFLSSCIFTLIINSIILLHFLQNSFKYNKLFEEWFWNHSAIIISLMIFCLFTDVGMIVSLFTSQIFGNLIFYAPLSLNDIKTMKSALILSIFIEHLPQLIVQCLAFFNESQSSWTTISITSLCVTCIDTFINCIKIIIWFVITKHMKMDTN